EAVLLCRGNEAAVRATKRRRWTKGQSMGEIVDGTEVDQLEQSGKIVFATKSPYDQQLRKLRAATEEAVAQGKPKPAIRLAAGCARTSVYGRAKAIGMAIEMAVAEDGSVYVRVADEDGEPETAELPESGNDVPVEHLPWGGSSKSEATTKPSLNVQPTKGEVRRAEILRFLCEEHGASSMRVTTRLRSVGDGTVDLQMVRAILRQMQNSGEVFQDGDTREWRLKPAVSA
ncbi:MAG: hypothetical protein KGI71_06145, partial [Patescibacteria group bacterium]|nr:hypothetical protein [Patescibacteria group bacterium]